MNELVFQAQAPLLQSKQNQDNGHIYNPQTIHLLGFQASCRNSSMMFNLVNRIGNFQFREWFMALVSHTAVERLGFLELLELSIATNVGWL
jgi:hypothetical protein